MNTTDQEPIPDPNPPQSPSGNQPSGTQASTPPPDYRDWSEQRRAARWSRREVRWQMRGMHHTGWFAGLLLILLGLALLLEKMNIPFFVNWWALFILIPAFWSFVVAWNIYQANHRLARFGAGSLTVGILLTLLALIFLFNLAVGFLWPALLIVGGVALLAIAFLPQ
jgi:hypothetical protein